MLKRDFNQINKLQGLIDVFKCHSAVHQ